MAVQNRLQRLSDAEVAGIAQLGSREAYDELVCRFRGAVLMVAGQSLRSRQAAEDVAQEAFLLAFQGLPRLQDPTKFPGWLYAITRHRAQRVALRESRSEAAEDSTLEHLMGSQTGLHTPGPLETVLQKETQASVRSVLDGLAPEIQTVLHLFYYEEWTAVRIGAFLSLPLTTIKWRLHTGKQQVRRHITAFLEEKPDVRTRDQQRYTPYAPPAAEDGGARRACGTDGQFRERSPQLRQALQCDCGAP
jgi:RNA polymerase sigma-70 factor (ECF subfamily)